MFFLLMYHFYSFLKHLILFIIGGIIYILIELGFRGHTALSMFFLGGLCFVLIGLINEAIPWNMGIIWQGIIGSGIVTSLELVSGLILNVYLKLNIWDYSNLPFNFMGQICLYFSIAWIFLSLVAIVLDDYLRYWFFNEEKPHYTLF